MRLFTFVFVFLISLGAINGEDIAENNIEDCSICCDAITANRWELSNCGHAYHHGCIREVTRFGHVSCPLCRRKILSNREMLHRIDLMTGKLQSYSEWIRSLGNVLPENYEGQLKQRVIILSVNLADAHKMFTMSLKFLLYHRFMHEYLVDSVSKLSVDLHERVNMLSKRKHSVLNQLKGYLSSGPMISKTFQQLRYNSYARFGIDPSIGAQSKLEAMSNYTETKFEELFSVFPVGYEPVGEPQYDAIFSRLIIFETLKYLENICAEGKLLQSLMHDQNDDGASKTALITKQKFLMTKNYAAEDMKITFDKFAD